MQLCNSLPTFLSHIFAAMGSREKLKCKWMACLKSRGCFGRFTKPIVIAAIDDPSKGIKFQGHAPNKPSVSDCFWSSSPCDMDHVNTSNRTMNPPSINVDMANPPEFVNHGLLLWNETRKHWVENNTSQNWNQARKPRLSWDATYESLLSTNRPFPRPIPLPDVVDFLVDIWEQEGLYD